MVPVPPVALAVAPPLFPPLHKTLVCEDIEIVGPPLLATIPVAVAVQPFASVAVTVYVPADKLLAAAPLMLPGIQL